MSLFIILILIGLLLISGIRVAQEYERALVFRLGRFTGLRGPGLYWIIPFIERQQTIDIRTKTVDLEQQETITKDSVTIKVNAVLWFRVVNPACWLLNCLMQFGHCLTMEAELQAPVPMQRPPFVKRCSHLAARRLQARFQ